MHIFFNCLGVCQGGQIKRAKQFLHNLPAEYMDDTVNITILSPSGLFSTLDKQKYNIIEITFIKYIPGFIFRFIYENIFLPFIVRSHRTTTFLTFSHSLPFLSLGCRSVVGVSNSAPFARNIYSRSGFFSKLRLFLLKISIVSACKKADAVLTLSQFSKHQLIDNGICKSKIHVIPNGSESFASFVPSKSVTDLSPFIDPTKKIILSVSHFYAYKNFETLVSAFSLLPVATRNDLQVVLCGHIENTAYHLSIKQLINAYQLDESIVIVPGLDYASLHLLYQLAHIFVFPSLVENCPNILLEAMSSGLPIVCSDSPPMPEFGGNSVLYFESLSPQSLSKQIQVLLHSDSYRSQLSKAALVQSELFNWKNFTYKVLSFCQDNS